MVDPGLLVGGSCDIISSGGWMVLEEVFSALSQHSLEMRKIQIMVGVMSIC